MLIPGQVEGHRRPRADPDCVDVCVEDCDDSIELGWDPVNTGDWTSSTGI